MAVDGHQAPDGGIGRGAAQPVGVLGRKRLEDDEFPSQALGEAFPHRGHSDATRR